MRGRRILVTGAGGGIGRGLVAELSARGAAVAAADLAGAELPPEAAARVSFDVRDTDAVEREVRAAAEALGGLDGVVGNAGVVDTVHRAHRFPLEAWSADLEANLTGQFAVLRAAAPALFDAPAGTAAVVLISSAAAEQGLPGQAAYTAAKAGLLGLVRTLAAEWGPRGVRVNAVLPGMIATPKVLALPEGMRDGIAAATPLQRLGEPADIAGAAAFLLSTDSAFVTGQGLRVDGGLGLGGMALATGASKN